MKKNLLISAIVIAAIAAGAGVGVVAENRVGIIDRILPAAGEAMTIEFGSFFKFAATQQFARAPEYMLADLATDAVPLATDAKLRLSESPLDANDVRQGVSDMLLEIAGTPASGKDSFMLNTVSVPIMTGANYGKFAALRDGVVEPEGVNGMVTAYATAALDGLLRFLSDLPCPEKEIPKENDAERQLDEWSDKLGSASGL